jgi:Protoglobin
MEITAIKGYTYGSAAASPVTMQDLNLLKQTVLFLEEDEKYLHMAGEVLKDQTDAVLDLWYGFVGGHPHLVHYFSKNGQPNMDYLAAVRHRFGQWIMDLCNRKFDQQWLNYQHEIGLRHHSIKKNKTDQVDTVPIIHFRYLVAFIFPITATIKSFLAKKGHSADEVDKMHAAWFKAVTLTVTLWCYPYINKGEF